jgi:hypothetical protein
LIHGDETAYGLTRAEGPYPMQRSGDLGLFCGGALSCEKGSMSSHPVVHQCPFCELVFSYHNEIKDHILHDHPEHADMAETAVPNELPH